MGQILKMIEQLEKARTKGAKDIKPRNHREAMKHHLFQYLKHRKMSDNSENNIQLSTHHDIVANKHHEMAKKHGREIGLSYQSLDSAREKAYQQYKGENPEKYEEYKPHEYDRLLSKPKGSSWKR